MIWLGKYVGVVNGIVEFLLAGLVIAIGVLGFQATSAKHLKFPGTILMVLATLFHFPIGITVLNTPSGGFLSFEGEPYYYMAGAVPILMIPAYLILLIGIYQLYHHNRQADNYFRSQKAIHFLGGFTTHKGENLLHLTNRQPTLFVFLRHFGCTFCRETLRELSENKAAITSNGTEIVLVHMVEDAHAHKYFKRYGLEEFPRLSDPEKKLYEAFELEKGTFKQLFGLRSWLEGFRAGLLKGHFVGLQEGDGFQMPGVFLVYKEKILQGFMHSSASDRPDYASLASCELEYEPA